MDQERYLTAVQVRQRFGGVSDMTLDRWLKSDKLDFPRPIKINRRRLFKESDVVAWEKRQRAIA